MFYIAEFLFTLAATSTKVAVLCLYLRIFPNRDFRMPCYIMLVATVLYFLTFTITSAMICQPTSYYWHEWNSEEASMGKCGNVSAHIISSFVISAVMDLIVFIMPIPQL